jgi:hypothetical protein
MTDTASLSTDDRVAIADLLARYARGLDSGDLDGCVHNFAADAVLFGAHSYLLWIQLGAGSPISAAAEYTDTLVKLDGRWVFQTRMLTRLAGRS